jgi:DNA-binding NarL/FixJ family response regulator
LLERDGELSALADALAPVLIGSRGSLVLVSGEAGVGKTALISRFCEAHRGDAPVLWGACAPLFTPHPLAPFVDVVEVAGPHLRELLEHGAKPYDIAVALARELGRRGPTTLVLEDLHWADEATLDVLRLLARDVERLPVLVLASYRDTELGATHPLRIVIGELGARPAVRRLRLTPLSPAAVATLAEPYAADPAEIYRKTAGNPFYVTEVLVGDEDEVPPTVRDAVLARAARLDASARRLLDAVAVAPPAAELWLLHILAEDCVGSLGDCLSSGMLVSRASAVAFRHELARIAVEQSIAPDRALVLHGAALGALAAPPNGTPDAARLAYHAEAAGDADAVLRFAPAAAVRAASLGAHREAAAQFARTLRFADGLPREELAGLLNRHSYECYVTTRDDDALASTQQAIECYRQLGDRRRRGRALAWRALVELNMGLAPDAERSALAAVSVLEELPAGRELAMTYCTLAGIALLAEDAESTATWGARAAALAERLHDTQAYANALGTVGALEGLRRSPEGYLQLERALALDREAGRESQMGRDYVLLGMAACRARSLDAMGRHVYPGLAFCEERDLDVWGRILLAMRSWIELERGDWEAAANTAGLVLAEECVLSCLQARVVLGLLRARRGDPDPWTPLAQANEVAERTGQLWWLAQVAAARAEAAWAQGKPDLVAAATDAAFALALRRRSSWPIAELCYWRRMAGIVEELPEDAGGPFALQLRGECAQAAEAWRAAGCPYEAGLALADLDDDDALLQARDELARLGARPAATIAARRLRERGVRRVPRGPNSRTRENSAGLTARELEVLVLLAEGLRNAQIAQRLVVSERTVGHHVSAVLRKMGVPSRGEAAAKAVRLGLITHSAASSEWNAVTGGGG